jgi:uncharacterized membrane protein YfcA
MASIFAFVAIGIISGVIMGFFGLAGGIVVIPGLMYLVSVQNYPFLTMLDNCDSAVFSD